MKTSMNLKDVFQLDTEDKLHSGLDLNDSCLSTVLNPGRGNYIKLQRANI